MKQTQEFDGKNIEIAVEKACLALNVSKKNLVYDVISSGSTGIFGIVGVKKARIRVTLPEKKDNIVSLKSSSDDNDRAGVMSIVDEAFGQEIKVPTHQSSSDKPIPESPLPEKPVPSESADSSGNESPLSVNGKNSERPKTATNRKKFSGDKPVPPKPRRGRPSGKKTANEKSGDVSPQKNNTKASISDDDTPAKSATDKSAAEASLSKRPAKGKPAPRRATGAKPYSRKNRVRKKDTWLSADGDAVLNDAMASTEQSITPSDIQEEISETQVISADNNSNSHLDATNVSDHSGIATSLEKSLLLKDTSEEENSAGADYEFLDEDFEGHTEEDDLLTRDDADIQEVYDERDDGYPPKYKGEIPVDVSEEAMRIGRETLQKMVALITDGATVVAQSDEDRLLLKVEGGNSGVLIGRRGQTLEAMQFLTDKIINRYSESRVRLKVDIEGYMETRKANLRTLAYKMADKAKKTGKPATINQMTAQDRRIVHIALKDDARVRTQSMGDGYYRRLVIFPKKSSFKRRKTFIK